MNHWPKFRMQNYKTLKRQHRKKPRWLLVQWKRFRYNVKGTVKEIMAKLNVIKIKNFCSSKNNVKRMRGSAWLGKHICTLWCYIFYGLWYVPTIVEEFHCPKSPLCSGYSPTIPPNLTSDNHWSVYYLHRFTFFRIADSWTLTVCSFFRLAFFT